MSLGINDLQTYRLAMDLGEQVWSIVINWDYFAKDTVGKQVVRAVDSVAANISEGFGRYHYKENVHFCFITRGSLLEPRTWIEKANKRLLISNDIYHQMTRDINVLGIKLNNYIKTLGKKPGGNAQVQEPIVSYESGQTDIDWDQIFNQ